MRRLVARIVGLDVRRSHAATSRVPHQRLTRNIDRSFFLRLFGGLFGIVLVAALLVTLIEGPRDGVGEFFGTLGTSFYWGVTTVMGSGQADYVSAPGASSSPGCSSCSGWPSSPRSPARWWVS